MKINPFVRSQLLWFMKARAVYIQKKRKLILDLLMLSFSLATACNIETNLVIDTKECSGCPGKSDGLLIMIRFTLQELCFVFFYRIEGSSENFLELLISIQGSVCKVSISMAFHKFRQLGRSFIIISKSCCSPMAINNHQ